MTTGEDHVQNQEILQEKRAIAAGLPEGQGQIKAIQVHPEAVLVQATNARRAQEAAAREEAVQAGEAPIVLRVRVQEEAQPQEEVHLPEDRHAKHKRAKAVLHPAKPRAQKKLQNVLLVQREVPKDRQAAPTILQDTTTPIPKTGINSKT